MVSWEKQQRHAQAWWQEYQMTLLRIGIILGVLVAAAAVGFLLAYRPYSSNLRTFALAGSVGAVAIVIVLNRFGRNEYGLLGVILLAGLFNFFTLPTGTQSKLVLSLVMAVSLCGLWFLDMLLIKKKFSLKPSPVNRPILIFIIIGVISFVWSILLTDPLIYRHRSFAIVQVAALFVNSLLPFMVIFVVNKIHEEQWLRYLTWIIIGISLFSWISIQFSLPTVRMVENGMRGMFITWAGALAYGQALFNEKLSYRQRGMLLLVLAIWVFWSFFQARLWLSGWFPLAVACGILTLLRSRQLFALFVLGGLFIAAFNYEYLYEEIVVANLDEGGGQRLDIWRMNLNHVSNHPWFGMGPAGYALYNMTYHPEDARSTHNNYFDILAQTGIIGLTCFIWMMGTFLSLGNRLRQKLTQQRNFAEGFANATLAGLLAALVSMTLGDWVLPFAYNQTISGFDNAVFTWMLIGGMIALYHIVETGEGNSGPLAVSSEQ